MQNPTPREHELYPHIERLRQDFGLQLSRHAENSFSLVVDAGEACRQLTPNFAAVSELEEYVAVHMTDILHDYLCTSGALPE